MKKVCFAVLGVCMAVGFSLGTAAQEHSAPMGGPPKVLTVTREFLKPGKSGTPHDKTESEFVVAMRDAKWPSYYFGLDSLSGKIRSIFLTGYDSFDAWEKDLHAQQKNPKLAPALEKAYADDAPLLDSVDQSVWFFREDQSHHPTTEIGSARMMELSVYRVKPGHEADWGDREASERCLRQGSGRTLGHVSAGLWRRTGVCGHYALEGRCGDRQKLGGGQKIRGSHGCGGDEEARGTFRRGH